MDEKQTIVQKTSLNFIIPTKVGHEKKLKII